jgi:hypothetical protein
LIRSATSNFISLATNFFGRGDQFAWGDVEGLSDDLERPESWIHLTPLDLTYVIPVQPGPLAQLFLRNAAFFTYAAHGNAEGTMESRFGHPTQGASLTPTGLPVKTGGLRPCLAALSASVLASVLLAGCGGTSAAPRSASTSTTEANPGSVSYRTEIRQWALSMVAPALQVSTMFSSQQNLEALLSRNAQARSSLDIQLNKLKMCTASVAKLGNAPPQYAKARTAAKAACARFEAGAALIEVGIDAASNGLGSGLLTRGANQISNGMTEAAAAVRRAMAVQ